MGITRNLLFGTLIGSELLKYSNSNPNPPDRSIDNTPTFGLIGGELFNKGAQAMTFTTVDILRDHYPNSNIVLFSSDEYLEDREEKLRFQILPWDEDVKLYLLGYNGDQLRERSWDEEVITDINDVIQDITAFFDISGYSLSSQLGTKTTVSYMVDILLSNKYDIPYYILPQSIGPLSYEFPQSYLVETLFRRYLPYVSLICPREQSGVDAVSQFTTSNVQLERDLVLQRSEYTLSNFSSDIETEVPHIESDAVGIIPNRNVLEYSNQDMVDIYKKSIDRIRSDHPVYILRHADDDGGLCDRLYEPFINDSQVSNLNRDFNAIQLETIISSFSFVIASRYHSIIHAYRAGVPAIVIGWAEKYRELLKLYNQSNYLLDCRDNIQHNQLDRRISRIKKSKESDAMKIQEISQAIRKNGSVLDDICVELNQ